MKVRLMPDLRLRFVDDDGTIVRETEPVRPGQMYRVNQETLEVTLVDDDE